MFESFAPVIGYESLYSVGTLGTVLRLPDETNCFRGRELKSALHKDTKYPVVTLTKNGKMKTFTVHSLVLLSFTSKPSGEVEVRHKDGNRSNPALENLEWGTRVENISDKIRHGRSGNKITSAIAADIKRRIKDGSETGSAIAKSYGISKSTICDIKAERYWKHA